MKKYLSGFLIGIMFSLVLFSSSLALANANIKLIVNGVDITSQSEVPPTVIGGRTLVPARALAEALGASVAWDAVNRTVVVTSNEPVSGGEPVDLPPISDAQDWLTPRELFNKYNNIITDVLVGDTLTIVGKKKINIDISNINSSTTQVYSDMGAVRIKMKNNQYYLSESQLKQLGII